MSISPRSRRGLQLVEAGPPRDEVVDLEHLDVAAEERQRGVDLALRLVVVGRPHLGGDDRLGAGGRASVAPRMRSACAVHRRRVDERGPGVEGGVGDRLADGVDASGTSNVLRRAHPDDGDARCRRTGGAPSSCLPLRADPLDELGDAGDEGVAVEALELLPRRQRRGVDDPVEEQPPVEVVALVLERAGGEAPLDLVVLVAVAVEVADAHVDVAEDVAAQVGHRQAALVDLDELVVERLDHRVDDDGQRDRRLVRVARVVVDLDDGDAHRLVDLVGGDAGAVGVRASCR